METRKIEINSLRTSYARFVRAQRYALHQAKLDYPDEFRLHVDIERGSSEERRTMLELLREVEQITGEPILSSTRAQMRRDGKYVN